MQAINFQELDQLVGEVLPERTVMSTVVTPHGGAGSASSGSAAAAAAGGGGGIGTTALSACQSTDSPGTPRLSRLL